MPLAELIEALSRAEAYRECGVGDPATLASIETRQTHISVVFLVGDFAWKVKKPVDLGFLDFSTLAKRLRFCEEELRVNRRTAPEIYLGVDAIVRDTDGSLQVTANPGDREVVDVAVRMKRLPEAGLLDRRLDRIVREGDGAERSSLRRLLVAFAPDLATFHAACPTGAGIDEHGGPDGMRRQFEENFARLEPFAGGEAIDVMTARRFEWLRTKAFERLEASRSRLDERMRSGRVREGHGDLHAGNLCALNDRLIAFDAIEFDARMRCRDEACEVAYLAMDLEQRGFASLAAAWTRAYAKASGDRDVIELAPLFRVHYAVVRTLVEAIRSRDAAVGDAERSSSLAAARRYADLATGHLLPPSLITTCGLQGTGKSTLARAIAAPLRAVVLRSDVIRKRLAGVALDDRRGLDEAGASLYSEAWTAKTYAALRQAAAAALGRGRHVVVDAGCSKASQRAVLVELAEVVGCPWVLAESTCDRDVVRRRLVTRASDRREPSDADWAVFEAAERRFERPTEIARNHRVLWPSDTPTQRGVTAAIESLL